MIGIASGVIGTFIVVIIILAVYGACKKDKKESLDKDEVDTNHVITVK